MANCNFTLPDNFMKQLYNMENADEIVTKMLKETAPIIVKEEKERLTKHKRSGAMINSVKATAVKENNYGHYVVVRPTGKDKDGVRNMEKFVYLEYGTSQQQSDPIQKKIVSSTSKEVEDKCQEIFKKEVGL